MWTNSATHIWKLDDAVYASHAFTANAFRKGTDPLLPQLWVKSRFCCLGTATSLEGELKLAVLYLKLEFVLHPYI